MNDIENKEGNNERRKTNGILMEETLNIKAKVKKRKQKKIEGQGRKKIKKIWKIKEK